jgi:hypothetical protein
VTDWRPRAVAGLLVAASVLLVIAVVVERNDGDVHRARPSTALEPAESGDEHSESGATAERDARVLGIDLESSGTVAVAVVAALALATAALWRPSRALFVVIIGFGGAFVVLDLAELAHQLDAGRWGLAVAAALIAAMHALSASIAGSEITARGTIVTRGGE